MMVQKHASLIVLIGFLCLGNAAVINVRVGDDTTVKPDEGTTTVKPDEGTTTVKPDEDTTTVKPDEDTTTVDPDAPTTTADPDAPTTTANPVDPTSSDASTNVGNLFMFFLSSAAYLLVFKLI